VRVTSKLQAKQAEKIVCTQNCPIDRAVRNSRQFALGVFADFRGGDAPRRAAASQNTPLAIYVRVNLK